MFGLAGVAPDGGIVEWKVPDGGPCGHGDNGLATALGVAAAGSRPSRPRDG